MFARPRGGRASLRGLAICSALAGLLSGCFGGDAEKRSADLKESALFSRERATPSSDLVQEILVMDRAVTIAVPKGFCVDKTALQNTEAGAFVPVGACAALTKNPADPKPKKPAFLAASVLPMPIEATAFPTDPAARLDSARTYLESPKGLAALSRAGKRETVTLLKVKATNTALHVLIKDTSAGLPDVLSNTTWRSFFEVNGMLVTASVTSFLDQDLGRDQGYDILKEFVRTIRKANPGAAGQGSGLKGLLGRLRK